MLLAAGLETTVSVSLIISVISAIGVIYTIVTKHKSEAEKETQKSIMIATNFAQLDLKLNEMNNKMSSIDRKYEKLDEKMDGISNSLSVQVERIGTLFKLYEDHEDRLKKLEEANK